jgi:hypothetical protein
VRCLEVLRDAVRRTMSVFDGCAGGLWNGLAAAGTGRDRDKEVMRFQRLLK